MAGSRYPIRLKPLQTRVSSSSSSALPTPMSDEDSPSSEDESESNIIEPRLEGQLLCFENVQHFQRFCQVERDQLDKLADDLKKETESTAEALVMKITSKMLGLQKLPQKILDDIFGKEKKFRFVIKDKIFHYFDISSDVVNTEDTFYTLNAFTKDHEHRFKLYFPADNNSRMQGFQHATQETWRKQHTKNNSFVTQLIKPFVNERKMAWQTDYRPLEEFSSVTVVNAAPSQIKGKPSSVSLSLSFSTLEEDDDLEMPSSSSHELKQEAKTTSKESSEENLQKDCTWLESSDEFVNYCNKAKSSASSAKNILKNLLAMRRDDNPNELLVTDYGSGKRQLWLTYEDKNILLVINEANKDKFVVNFLLSDECIPIMELTIADNYIKFSENKSVDETISKFFKENLGTDSPNLSSMKNESGKKRNRNEDELLQLKDTARTRTKNHKISRPRSEPYTISSVRFKELISLYYESDYNTRLQKVFFDNARYELATQSYMLNIDWEEGSNQFPLEIRFESNMNFVNGVGQTGTIENDDYDVFEESKKGGEEVAPSSWIYTKEMLEKQFQKNLSFGLLTIKQKPNLAETSPVVQCWFAKALGENANPVVAELKELNQGSGRTPISGTEAAKIVVPFLTLFQPNVTKLIDESKLTNASDNFRVPLRLAYALLENKEDENSVMEDADAKDEKKESKAEKDTFYQQKIPDTSLDVGQIETVFNGTLDQNATRLSLAKKTLRSVKLEDFYDLMLSRAQFVTNEADELKKAICLQCATLIADKRISPENVLSHHLIKKAIKDTPLALRYNIYHDQLKRELEYPELVLRLYKKYLSASSSRKSKDEIIKEMRESKCTLAKLYTAVYQESKKQRGAPLPNLIDLTRAICEGVSLTQNKYNKPDKSNKPWNSFRALVKEVLWAGYIYKIKCPENPDIEMTDPTVRAFSKS